MKKPSKTVTGFFLLGTLSLLFLVLLLYSVGSRETVEMLKPEVSGASLVSGENYLRFIGAVEGVPENRNLVEIRERLLQHVYVEDVVIEKNSPGNISIQITEKRIIGIVVRNEKSSFLTTDLALLKILPGTSVPTVTLINGLEQIPDHKVVAHLEKAREIIFASGIDTALVQNRLSEIIFGKDGNAALLFSDVHSYILIGKDRIPEKVAAIYSMYKTGMMNSAMLQNSAYIDMRYKNKIYCGS